MRHLCEINKLTTKQLVFKNLIFMEPWLVAMAVSCWNWSHFCCKLLWHLKIMMRAMKADSAGIFSRSLLSVSLMWRNPPIILRGGHQATSEGEIPEGGRLYDICVCVFKYIYIYTLINIFFNSGMVALHQCFVQRLLSDEWWGATQCQAAGAAGPAVSCNN